MDLNVPIKVDETLSWWNKVKNYKNYKLNKKQTNFLSFVHGFNLFFLKIGFEDVF